MAWLLRGSHFLWLLGGRGLFDDLRRFGEVAEDDFALDPLFGGGI